MAETKERNRDIRIPRVRQLLSSIYSRIFWAGDATHKSNKKRNQILLDGERIIGV
jgi:hypothetical protein